MISPITESSIFPLLGRQDKGLVTSIQLQVNYDRAGWQFQYDSVHLRLILAFRLGFPGLLTKSLIALCLPNPERLTGDSVLPFRGSAPGTLAFFPTSSLLPQLQSLEIFLRGISAMFLHQASFSNRTLCPKHLKIMRDFTWPFGSPQLSFPAFHTQTQNSENVLWLQTAVF